MILRERGSLTAEVFGKRNAYEPPEVLTIIANTPNFLTDSKLESGGFRTAGIVRDLKGRASSRWVGGTYLLGLGYGGEDGPDDYVAVVAMLAGPATPEYATRFGHTVNLHPVYANLLAWAEETDFQWVPDPDKSPTPKVTSPHLHRLSTTTDKKGNRTTTREILVPTEGRTVHVDIDAFVRMGMTRAVGFFSQDYFLDSPTVWELWQR